MAGYAIESAIAFGPTGKNRIGNGKILYGLALMWIMPIN
jgi:hypothetical protein